VVRLFRVWEIPSSGEGQEIQSHGRVHPRRRLWHLEFSGTPICDRVMWPTPNAWHSVLSKCYIKPFVRYINLASALYAKYEFSFDVHVTVHTRQGEGKESTRCDKVCSFIASYIFQVWPPKSGRYSLIVLLMMGILVHETCWGNKTAYSIASSWFFTFSINFLVYATDTSN
jgi:hypothetical protein